MILDSVKQLYRYRWLVLELVLRNLRLRYRGSALGVFWTLLNPLLFMAVYTLVFEVFLKVGLPNYPLYLLCGLIPFTFFGSSLQQGALAIIDGRYYVGRTLFPTVALVVVPVLTNAANFLIAMPLVVALALVLKVHLGWNLLLLPVVFLAQLLVTQSVVVLLATFNVFYRDVQELLGYAMSALLFLTPIFYKATSIPVQYRGIIALNPLAALTDSYQRILYDGTLPDFSRLGYAFVLGVVGLLVANAVFARYREAFAQYL